MKVAHQRAHVDVLSEPVLPVSLPASMEMRRELEAVADELRSVPTHNGLLQLAPFERLLSRLHHAATRLLWRHLTIEWCAADAVRSRVLAVPACSLCWPALSDQMLATELQPCFAPPTHHAPHSTPRTSADHAPRTSPGTYFGCPLCPLCPLCPCFSALGRDAPILWLSQHRT